MPTLHISKVAFGCASIETLRRRQAARLDGDCVDLVTRFMPTRAEELIGGSVFWIVKHRLAARQTILALAAREKDRKTVISLSPELVPVRAIAKRAHQGWRYLSADDAPPDFADCDDDDGLMSLPVELAGKLTSLALI
jgi:hypothetical protein